MQSTTDITMQVGSVRRFNGTLCVSSESDCLFRHAESKQSIEVIDSGFFDDLLDNVPCRIGGPLLYDDDASIVGTLERINDRLALVRVSEILVRRENNSHQFTRDFD
jgi:hypothetical protein